MALAAAPLWWGCTGRAGDQSSSDGDGNKGGESRGAGGNSETQSLPLSPADLSTACTKDTPFPRRLLRLAAPEIVASLKKAAPTSTLVLSAELNGTQTQRADDSLVVSRFFYDAVEEASKSLAKQLPMAAASPLGCEVAKFGIEEACTTNFLSKWLPVVFRGRNDANDSKALSALAQTVASRSGGARAFEIVVRATVQSPKFLYLPEGVDALLAGKATGSAPLSGLELASFLSYRRDKTNGEGEQLSGGTALHTKLPLTRDDGAVFKPVSYGFGGYEVLYGTEQVHSLAQAPAGNITARYYAMRSVTTGQDMQAAVKVAVPVAQSPTAVYRTNDSDNSAVPLAKDKMTLVTSDAAMKANPLTSFQYDTATKTVRFYAMNRWVAIMK